MRIGSLLIAVACAQALAATSTHAAPRETIPAGAQEAWLALLHYRHVGTAWRSEVHDPSFFLAPDGSTNPVSEWAATQRALLRDDPHIPADRQARCRFPARLALMRRALGWPQARVPDADCRDFHAFRRKLDARSLSVVFASHYVANPASAFGHTMLYLGSDGPRGAMLADHAVGFEADTEGMSPLGYIPRGLAGGLVASYRVTPLHERVRKYERGEQRDLWFFRLDLPRTTLDQLVRHLWELQPVSYRYGFFGANCAQKLLALVHAVAPHHQLLPLDDVAVLPSEVVKRFAERIGVVDHPLRRPSLRSRYNRRRARLTAEERAQLDEMIATRALVEDASPAVLSAALLWSELETPHRAFRRASESGSHRDLRWRRDLWAARVAAGARAPDEDVVAVVGSSLLDAHAPARVSLAAGYDRRRGPVASLGARWLLHDAVDPQAGYPWASSLEAARVAVSTSRRGLSLDEATALRVEKLAPGEGDDSPLAWRAELGARRLPRGAGAPLHVGAELGIGLGAGIRRAGGGVAVYSMLGARPGVAFTGDEPALALDGVASAGALVQLPLDVRARLAGEYVVPAAAVGERAGALTATVRKGLARNWDLTLDAMLGHATVGATLGLVAFR